MEVAAAVPIVDQPVRIKSEEVDVQVSVETIDLAPPPVTPVPGPVPINPDYGSSSDSDPNSSRDSSSSGDTPFEQSLKKFLAMNYSAMDSAAASFNLYQDEFTALKQTVTELIGRVEYLTTVNLQLAEKVDDFTAAAKPPSRPPPRVSPAFSYSALNPVPAPHRPPLPPPAAPMDVDKSDTHPPPGPSQPPPDPLPPIVNTPAHGDLFQGNRTPSPPPNLARRREKQKENVNLIPLGAGLGPIHPSRVPNIAHVDDDPPVVSDEDQYFPGWLDEPVAPVQASWAAVARTGASKTAGQPVAKFTKGPSAPLIRPGPSNKTWIVKFHGNPPPKGERLSSQAMAKRLRGIDRAGFPFDVQTVDWSRKGLGDNIMVTFSDRTPTKNIDTQSNNILAALRHEVKGATFTENIRQSKVVAQRIPTRLDTDCREDMDTEMPLTHVLSDFLGNEHFRALQGLSPLRWTVNNLDTRSDADVVFSFDDPDGDIAADFVRQPLYAFGREIRSRIWNVQINVSQCTSCWKLGPPHQDCTMRCRFCGRGTHSEKDHVRFCQQCVKSQNTDPIMCDHRYCTNCNFPGHNMDDDRCPARQRQRQNRIQNNRDRTNVFRFAAEENYGSVQRNINPRRPYGTDPGNLRQAMGRPY